VSLKKQYLKKKPICKVTFSIPASQSNNAETVYVVGDFNNWSTSATPMKRSKTGLFEASVNLETGREYQFRYLYDNHLWDNETEADKFAATSFKDARNSVLVL